MISGVEEVESFDESAIFLTTAQGGWRSRGGAPHRKAVLGRRRSEGRGDGERPDLRERRAGAGRSAGPPIRQMTIDTVQQGQALCQALALGGAVWAAVRPVPYSESPGEAARGGSPAGSGVLAGGHGDSVSLVPGGLGGQIRFYGALFCMAGGGVYFWVISPWFLKLGYFMADIVTFLLGILTFPLALGRAVLKKFGKLAKNTFLSGVKWYRIGQKTEEMERAVRRRAARRERRGCL